MPHILAIRPKKRSRKINNILWLRLMANRK